MPFTGVLGTANTRPGNTVPGLGGASNALNKSASNTLVLSQNVHVNVTYNRGINHSLSFTQSSGRVFFGNASNTLSMTVSAVADLVENTAVSHTLTLTQLATYTMSRAVSASNALMIGQSAISTQQLNRAVSQTLTLTQFAVKTLPESVPHTLTLSHSVGVVKVKRAGVIQALTLSQTVVVAKTYGRVVSQGLPLVQTVVKTTSRLKPVSNTLALTQIALGVASKHTASSLTLTQTATAVRSHGVRHRLELTQVARENHTVSKRVFDVLPVFHVLARALTLRRTLSHSLTFTQSATAEIVRAARSTLVLTQQAVCDKVKPGFSELVLVQGAICRYSLQKPANNTLFLQHNVALQKATFKPASHVLSLSQYARGTRVISVNVSHTVPLSQDLVRDRYVRSINQTLVLAQTVSGPKIAPRSVSHSLVLTHGVTVAKTLLRSVNHTLVFQNSFTRYVGLPGQPVVTIPTVQAVVVRNLLILESGPYAVTLSAPEWNDKEGGNGKINIKRAMDGTRRVYKRDQPSSNLTYDLVMDRLKAIELRTFVLNCNSSVIRLTNWKGEIWVVVLTNNPFTFTEEAYWDSPWGNKSTVTLEFRGVKLN